MFSFGSSFVVALDANVLFGYPLRDTLLLAVEADLYRPAWSDEIWQEVIRNLEDPRRKRPYGHGDMLRLMARIRESFPDAFVEGYQALTPTMPVAAEDQHVAAMAVHARVQVVVTYNCKHFPPAALAPYGIDVQSPDEFLYNLYQHAPLTMVQLVRDQAALLKNPPKTPAEILDALEATHIKRFAQAIRTHLAAE